MQTFPRDTSARQAAETVSALSISKEAADAAKKAAEVAESALLNIERPYLFVSASSFKIGINSTDSAGSRYHPVVTYSVANHGKLPAVIDMVCAGVIHAPDERLAAPLGVDNDDPLMMERVIESNGWRQGLTFKESAIDSKVVNNPALTGYEVFFWFVIHYHGPFTQRHETSGCWRVSFDRRDELKLLQYGGNDYNYHK